MNKEQILKTLKQKGSVELRFNATDKQKSWKSVLRSARYITDNGFTLRDVYASKVEVSYYFSGGMPYTEYFYGRYTTVELKLPYIRDGILIAYDYTWYDEWEKYIKTHLTEWYYPTTVKNCQNNNRGCAELKAIWICVEVEK